MVMYDETNGQWELQGLMKHDELGGHKTFGAHDAICSSNIIKRLINYVINTYDNINDFNLVDLFHHQETTIL